MVKDHSLTGMGRTVKFDARKNSERKKRAALQLRVSIPLDSLPQSLPTSLVVSLPISAYTSSKVDDTSLLQLRLKTSHLLPAGWALTDNEQLPSSVTIFKCPLFAAAAAAGVVYTFVVAQNLMWRLRLGESVIRPDIELLSGCSLTISTVGQILELLAGACMQSRFRPDRFPAVLQDVPRL